MVSKCCSSSPIEGIHASEISVSRIVAISDGGRQMSAIKLDKGLSIFYAKAMVNNLKVRSFVNRLARRLLSLLSTCLLRSCRSDIWPDTALKSL